MQEPFDTFDKKYLRELSAKEVDALDSCLGRFKLDHLLGALFEFIETYVRNAPENYLKWP